MGRSLVWLLAFNCLLLASCVSEENSSIETSAVSEDLPNTYLQVLGVAQDAGYPQIGCAKFCCESVHFDSSLEENVVSLGLVDHDQTFLFEATPDINEQVHLLNEKADLPESKLPDGVFVTHAHIGHYTGLMQFGREAFGAKDVPVYAMPRMKTFLEENGPWSQLVSLKNINIKKLTATKDVILTNNLNVTPILVPHRDEFSETVGYSIQGQQKTALFIPDIDKWEKWPAITDWIKKVDYAFLDATFYNGHELPGRDMSEVPHPSVEESMEYFKELSEEDKAKIYFIHFNHTNPLMHPGALYPIFVEKAGFNIAKEGQIFQL